MSLNLPTLAEVSAVRRAQPKGAAPSRLQAKAAKATDERKAEAVWKTAVWTRDHGQCRWCKRKVLKCLELVPERGEVHHVSGRVVQAIRWDRRNGLLLCASCHERITGKVAEKVVLVPTKTFTVGGVSYANANKRVRFTRVV